MAKPIIAKSKPLVPITNTKVKTPTANPNAKTMENIPKLKIFFLRKKAILLSERDPKI